MKKLILGVFLALAAVGCYAQEFKYQPRMRVIIDNDFAGDPVGLVALAHHLNKLPNPDGRPIRIYTDLDTRHMFADMEAKLQMARN